MFLVPFFVNICSPNSLQPILDTYASRLLSQVWTRSGSSSQSRCAVLPIALCAADSKQNTYVEVLQFRAETINPDTPLTGVVVSRVAAAVGAAAAQVVSYHTHIPEYIPRYNLWTGLVAPMWALIKMCSRWCNLCLVTSSVMQKELADNGCKQLDLWQRGVDTKTFNPSFRSEDMKASFPAFVRLVLLQRRALLLSGVL